MTHKNGEPLSEQQTNQVQESMVRIDLLAFFQANPHTVDTVDGLARRLHRLPDEIRPALDFLSRIGVLQKANYGRLDLFWLNKGEMINSFFNE
ncbi:MAG: hypothetical protein RJR35_06965 [Thermoanaerobacterales bacterium]|nr:hypothetical protein [Thermoanaerobacterales bacterium]